MATALGGPQEVDTIFVGGGTPTRLDAAQLERLTGIIRRWLVRAPGGEWTVEANPGTLDAEKADVLAEAGVDRVSLGAQSFRPESLRVLERHHGRAEVEQAVAIVRPAVPAVVARPDLRRARLDARRLAQRPGDRARIRSRASLLLRAGLREGDRPVETTAERARSGRSTRRSSGRCTRPPSSGSPSAGLAMYEISNFARPGHESRHNLVYWANDAYFGFGVGAARYVRGVRSVNTRDLPALPPTDRSRRAGHRPERGADARGPGARDGVLMLRRTAMGIDRDDFRRRTGFELDRPGRPGHRTLPRRGIPRRRRRSPTAQPRRGLRGRPGALRIPLASMMGRRVRRSSLVPDGSRVGLTDLSIAGCYRIFGAARRECRG